jgi:hypothetical protein
MKMTMVIQTVLGGVLVFVIGQIVLKLIIEPVQELKRSLGSTCHSLLLHQAKLTNAASDRDIAGEMKLKSAEILSKSQAVLWYSLVRIVFGLPSEVRLLKASHQLNRLYYGMIEESKKFEDSAYYNGKKTDFALENTRAVQEVGRLLGLKTTYQGS